jgi:3-methyladenine DNA glycosylase AlkD
VGCAITMTAENSASNVAKEISGAIGSLDDLSTAALRNVRRQFSKSLAKAPARFVVDVATMLVEKSIGHRMVGYELIAHHKAAMNSLDEADLLRLGQTISSWGSVDMFGCYISGPAWRERQVPDAMISRWARSENRWFRRAALVSTVPLNSKARGGNGDSIRTLEVCSLLISDRDDMVVKALSWALRELAKRDQISVRRFLNEHQEQLAARVTREVRNKLATGLKNPRIRVSKANQ